MKSLRLAALGLLVVLGIACAGWRAVATYRAPGPFDGQPHGFWDFHQGVYFPARAFVEGVSPYTPEYVAKYPADRPTPAYSPGLFLVHAPIALLPLRVAEWVYFVLNVCLCLALGYAAVRVSGAGARHSWTPAQTLAVAAALVWSRPGQITLKDGYFTLLLVLGTIASLELARRRPWLAAVGYAAASLKPTYAIPLVLVLVARGEFRAAIRGVALAALLAGVAAGWLVYWGGPGALTAAVTSGQAEHLADFNEMPVNNWTRVDLFAVFAKWIEINPGEGPQLLVMGVLLVPVALALRRLAPAERGPFENGCGSLAGATALLAIVVTLYHHFYDTLLVAPVAVAALWSEHPSWRTLGTRPRWTVAALSLVPWFNLLTTGSMLKLLPEWTHRFVTSIDPLCLAIALGLLITHALRFEKKPQKD